MGFYDIKNKVAVVTGAAEGIGLSITKHLLEHGARVVINDINADKLKEVVGVLDNKYPGNVGVTAGDASKLDVIDELIETALRSFGTVDFAVANAGITLFGNFYEFSPENFDRVMHVNLKGAFFLTQRIAKALRKENKGGRVVLMSSNVGILSYPNLTAYSMTKAALSMMARSLVLELAPYNITINAIAPGATITKRTRTQEPDYEQAWASIIPRGKPALPEDIAKSCLFLLSKDAEHINGETLVIDGGWSAIGQYPKN